MPGRKLKAIKTYRPISEKPRKGRHAKCGQARKNGEPFGRPTPHASKKGLGLPPSQQPSEPFYREKLASPGAGFHSRYSRRTRPKIHGMSQKSSSSGEPRTRESEAVWVSTKLIKSPHKHVTCQIGEKSIRQSQERTKHAKNAPKASVKSPRVAEPLL